MSKSLEFISFVESLEESKAKKAAQLLLQAVLMLSQMSDTGTHGGARKKIVKDLGNTITQVQSLKEAKGQIAAFAKKSGKSEKEVETLWLKIKQKLIADGLKENEEKFFPILVASLKRSLGVE